MELAEVGELLELLLPLFILQFILMIAALIAWVKTDQTKGPKWVWLLIIILANLVGPILFFIIGRRQD
ncbi:membrane protein DedA with SNARE-associated domain [Natronobacillus azotifigens]|uniref:PLD nuclease N-terminal domain-containing protein n=1 Tax=Natronobacillus azotifigens TaxID=472978 RepID=A0A9J6RBD2_9BACI|nr:PLD nuclease N-terminal domain-containing protein [Natronobacillus azotifigens]MCZ0702845.1 PLD nuclease N-terminal domain-containing protein [Natronobacillus azotifigens]